jgi:hypothetical protein
MTVQMHGAIVAEGRLLKTGMALKIGKHKPMIKLFSVS